MESATLGTPPTGRSPSLLLSESWERAEPLLLGFRCAMRTVFVVRVDLCECISAIWTRSGWSDIGREHRNRNTRRIKGKRACERCA